VNQAIWLVSWRGLILICPW